MTPVRRNQEFLILIEGQGLLIEREDFEKAETQYRVLIELAPESADCRYYLGSILHNIGDIKGARGEFLKALAIDSGHILAGRALLESMRLLKGPSLSWGGLII